jgi:hypothetical protein
MNNLSVDAKVRQFKIILHINSWNFPQETFIHVENFPHKKYPTPAEKISFEKRSYVSLKQKLYVNNGQIA